MFPENIVTVPCWDNCDLNEETPLGTGTKHTAHRIIAQKVPRVNIVVTQSALPENSSNVRNKARSLSLVHQDIEHYLVKAKQSHILQLPGIRHLIPNPCSKQRHLT